MKTSRLASSRAATNELAKTPMLFGEVRQPTSSYIAIPRVSSCNRNYIPIAILSDDVIAGDKVYTISTDDKYLLGIMTSEMHMVWMRMTSGRLKSDYSYSNQLTYNNFPWPKPSTSQQIKSVRDATQHVLDVRAQYPDASLADLYDPLTMPPPLLKAHQQLDKAVDSCYRNQSFASDSERMNYLFELYEHYTSKEPIKGGSAKKLK